MAHLWGSYGPEKACRAAIRPMIRARIGQPFRDWQIRNDGDQGNAAGLQLGNGVADQGAVLRMDDNRVALRCPYSRTDRLRRFASKADSCRLL
jgi:hypothetical protein